MHIWTRIRERWHHALAVYHYRRAIQHQNKSHEFSRRYLPPDT